MKVNNIDLEFDNDELMVINMYDSLTRFYINKKSNKILVFDYNIYDLPKEDELKDLKISKENIELLKDCELVVDDTIFIYKPLITKVGKFYISNDEEIEHFYCKLFDEDKKWVANIYNRSVINDLSNIQEIEDLVEIGVASEIMGANSLDELLQDFSDFCEVNSDEPIEWEKDLQYKDMFIDSYVCRVGNKFFLVDYYDL